MGSETSAAYTILNARPCKKNTLIGYFNLQMPSGLRIRDMMLHESHGKRWVQFSSKEWTNPDGSKGYSPILEFASREVSDRFQATIRPLAERALLGEAVSP
jgi:hypothetical protein